MLNEMGSFTEPVDGSAIPEGERIEVMYFKYAGRETPANTSWPPTHRTTLEDYLWYVRTGWWGLPGDPSDRHDARRLN